MALSTIEALFSKVFASGWTGDELTVIWHAGEPLVLPVSYYETAFRAIEALRPPALALRHAFQTNGMLITPEWCALFKDWDVGVGVSIDGPQALHDANRVTRSGRGTFERTVAGMRLLRQEDVPFHVISVLSAESLRSPEEMLDFYLAEGVEDICFNVEESEGDHVSELFAAANFDDRFRDLPRAVLDAGAQKRARALDPRDRRYAAAHLPARSRRRRRGRRLANVQAQPFGMLNVACDGSASSFSPELLGLKNAAYNDFIIGNVLTALARGHAGRRGDDGDGARHRRRGRDLPEDLRVFFRVRRRHANQQAVRKRPLRQRRDLVLPAHRKDPDRSRARRLRPAGGCDRKRLDPRHGHEAPRRSEVTMAPRIARRRASQPEVGEPWMIGRALVLRPEEFALGFPDRQIIDRGEAARHQAVLVELPVLIAVGAKPVA